MTPNQCITQQNKMTPHTRATRGGPRIVDAPQRCLERCLRPAPACSGLLLVRSGGVAKPYAAPHRIATSTKRLARGERRASPAPCRAWALGEAPTAETSPTSESYATLHRTATSTKRLRGTRGGPRWCPVGRRRSERLRQQKRRRRRNPMRRCLGLRSRQRGCAGREEGLAGDPSGAGARRGSDRKIVADVGILCDAA